MYFGNTKQQNTTNKQGRILAAIIAHLLGVHKVRTPSSKFSSLKACHNIAKSSFNLIMTLYKCCFAMASEQENWLISCGIRH